MRTDRMRMRRLRSIGWLAALALAVPAAAQVPPPRANPYSDRLARLTEVERRAALRASINDSDGYCRRIGDVRFQQSFKNLKMWVARCDSGADYGLFIGPDGTVQMRKCGELAGLKLPTCRLAGLKPGPKPTSPAPRVSSGLAMQPR